MANEASGLDPYIPRLAAEWELDAPGALWREMEATCCFVDISGFTALSERLAKRGRIGAEELTEVLNHVFSRMLEVAYGKGGALLKFGGDALLLAFTGDDHPRMAAEGAVAMRAALREARTLPTSVGRLNLRMSIGVHSGVFHLFRVGDIHRELIITGPAASTTTRMEGTADAGEIVISPDTAARLPVAAVGEVKDDGRLLRWRHVVEGGRGPIPARPVPAAAVEMSVPIALRARLTQRGGEAEHRLASVAFVKYSGTDDLLASDGPDATAAALDSIVRSVQRAADLESVTFLASDIDANGGKIILTTGVPATQEDDEGRILRAVRMVMDEQHPLPVRVGVNRGHVFSGDIGTDYRRTFTVMGDTVNLAARLMAAAKPGEIYATGAVLDQARTRFGTEVLEPFYVKGKSEPVQAYRVGEAAGTRSDSFGTLPFRGRDKELTTLTQALEAAATGRGDSVLIEAERGVGKTRLIDEFKASSPAEAVLWLQGEPRNAGVPYQPLRSALRRVLDIGARERTEAGRELLATLTRLDERIAPFAPLLAVVVDAEVAPTPESEAIAEEFMQRRIADIVVDTLDAACATPLLIVADDAHWFDDTTSEICQRLAAVAASRRWLICVTRRPHLASGFTPTNSQTISLPLLGDDVARELVEAVTETAPLRPHECDGVVTRAGGNPLFLEELLRIVRDTDIESLPDSLDAVAMREIDGLPTTPRRVLRLASVLGRSFDRSLIDQLLAVETVDAGADALEDLGAQLVADGDGGRIRFRHALLQEAAYQSLPFRQRLELHRIVGEIIERGATEDDDVAPLLSLHFLAAQDWDRTWRYAREAATSAREAHALAEAAIHLDRAVSAARRLGDVAGEELADVFAELGRAHELLGDYEQADDAYRRATTCETDPLRRGQIAYRRSYLRSEYLGKPGAAVRMLRSARKNLDRVGEEAAGLQALLLAGEASARQRQGRITEAIACAELAAEQAERSGEKQALAIAQHVRSLSFIMAGRTDEIDFMDRVLELFKELGDDVRVAMTLGNIAVIAFYESQWDKSTHYLTLSAEASTKAGDLACAAMTRGNLGELLTDQGRTAEAVSILGPAARTLESVGWTVMTAGTEAELGRAMAYDGDCEGGLVHLRSAVAVLDEIGAHYEALEAYARLVDILVFDNRLTEARSALARARELERVLGETQLAPHIDRLELILAAKHDGGMSSTALESFLERARRIGATYDELVILALAERLGDPTQHEHVARLSRDLGVVRLPMFIDA
jgi:class 3 adenylate cyclase/tetratricopeptide (TPR) repeat protein